MKQKQEKRAKQMRPVTIEHAIQLHQLGIATICKNGEVFIENEKY